MWRLTIVLGGMVFLVTLAATAQESRSETVCKGRVFSRKVQAGMEQRTAQLKPADSSLPTGII